MRSDNWERIMILKTWGFSGNVFSCPFEFVSICASPVIIELCPERNVSFWNLFRFRIQPLHFTSLISNEESNIEDMNTTSILHLPGDCLDSIYQYLSLRDLLNMGQVCQQWRNMAADGVGWRNIRSINCFYLKMLYGFTDEDIVTILIRSGSYLRELFLDLDRTTDRLTALEDNCLLLKKLALRFEIDYDPQNNLMVSNLLLKPQALDSVCLEHAPFSFWEHCSKIPKTVGELQLTGHTRSQRISLDLPRFQQLHTLQLECLRLDENDLGQLQSLEHLTTLKIIRCDVNDGFSDSVTKITTLKCFILDHGWDFGNENLVKLLNNSQGMETLSVGWVRFGLNGHSLRAITSMPLLKKLELKNIKLPREENLIGNMSTLEEFDATNAGRLSVDTILRLVKNSTQLRWLAIFEVRRTRDFIRDINDVIMQNPEGRATLVLEVAEKYERWVNAQHLSPLLEFEYR